MAVKSDSLPSSSPPSYRTSQLVDVDTDQAPPQLAMSPDSKTSLRRLAIANSHQGSASPKPTIENLKRIAGDPYRRSSYGADFLKQVAKTRKAARHGGHAGSHPNFKVVTGSRAMSIYDKFIG